jgi:hypothetical protein
VRYSGTAARLESGGAILAGLMLLVCAPSLLRAGEIYKSVDAQGHVVYSDPDADAKREEARQAMAAACEM